MSRLTFSLPFFSIVPISIGILMLLVFFVIFNALRFLQCTSWVLLPIVPEKPDALLGTLNGGLFIETASKSIYCYKQNQWSKCIRPSYKFRPDVAPSWLTNALETEFEDGSVLQVIRAGNLSHITYHSLLADRRIFSCSTNFNTEIENIFRSGLFLWLLVPAIAIIWSVVSLVSIFIKYGQPTLWDFWGRGTRIK